MNQEQEILRLIDLVRALEDRVRDLEDGQGNELDPAIGFDVDDPNEHDSDETEYVRYVRPFDYGWNHYGG